MLADCKGNSHLKDGSLPNIQIEIEALNEGSQFSEEQWYIGYIIGIVFIVLVYLLGISAWGLRKEFKVGESLESPLSFLLIGILAEFI